MVLSTRRAFNTDSIHTCKPRPPLCITCDKCDQIARATNRPAGAETWVCEHSTSYRCCPWVDLGHHVVGNTRWPLSSSRDFEKRIILWWIMTLKWLAQRRRKMCTSAAHTKSENCLGNNQPEGLQKPCNFRAKIQSLPPPPLLPPPWEGSVITTKNPKHQHNIVQKRNLCNSVVILLFPFGLFSFLCSSLFCLEKRRTEISYVLYLLILLDSPCREIILFSRINYLQG